MKKLLAIAVLTFVAFSAMAQQTVCNVAIPETSPLDASRITAQVLNRCGVDSTFTVNNTQIVPLYLQEGLADAVLYFSIDSAPQNGIKAIEPVANIIYAIVAPKGAAKVEGWQGLSGKRVAYLHNDFYTEKNLEQGKDAGTVKYEVANEEELFETFRQNKCDYGVISYIDGKKRKPLPLDVQPAGFCPLLQIYLYFSKDRAGLAHKFSQELNALKAEGLYSDILNYKTGGNNDGGVLFLSSYDANTQESNSQKTHLQKFNCEVNFVNIPKDIHKTGQALINNQALSALHSVFATQMPQIIISDGQSAADFLCNNYRILFANIPVVISGELISAEDFMQTIPPNYSFILQKPIGARQTVQKILEVFPKTKNILVINSNDSAGRAWKTEIQKQLDQNFEDLTIVYSDSIKTELLPRFMRSLENHSAVLIGNMGNLQLTSSLEECKVPVFSLKYDSYFRYAVGGSYCDNDYYFERLENLVNNVLCGTPFPAACTAIENPLFSRYLYNHSTVRRYFVISSGNKKFTDGVFIGKPQSFVYTGYFKAIIIAFICFLALSSMVFSINTRLHQRSLKEQLKIQKNLIEENNQKFNLIFSSCKNIASQDLSQNFYNRLSNSLEFIAKQCQMNKASIWNVSLDTPNLIPQCNLVCKWEDNSTDEKMSRFDFNLNLDTFFPDWNKIFKNPEPVVICQSQSSGLIKYQLASGGVMCRLLLPIKNGSGIWGFACFDNTKHETMPDPQTINSLNACVTNICFKILEHESEQMLKEAKDAAISGTNAKSTFLANMSHEIRTPLNAILGMSELTLMDKNLAPHIRDYAQNINNSSRNLLGIINDILDFSKIESGKFELVTAPYNFDSMIHDVISMTRIRAHDTFLSFLIRIAPDLPRELIGDELRIKQILLNLLTNAIKYTKEGSITMTISGVVEENDLNLVIEVQDTGIGIKAEDQQKLFTMFERLDTKRNRNIEGTGLGLAICKQLCELMDGSLDFSSEYGNGSTFTLQLHQKIKNHQPLVKTDNLRSKSVIIFEPRRRNRRFLAILLSDLGIQPELCSTYTELAEILKKNKKFDWVFCSSQYFNKVKATIHSSDKNVKLALLADSEYDFAQNKDVKMLKTPLYCVPLANLLNEKPSFKHENVSFDSMEQIYSPDLKVLVVDDNIVNLKVATGLLEIHGVKAETANSGFDAIEILKNQNFDMIFMDHLMPEMDGIEAAHEIRKMQNKNAKSRIIALTANAINGMKEKFLDEGFDDFLSKPIENSALNTLLARWVPEDKIEDSHSVNTENVENVRQVIVIPGVNTALGVEYAGSNLTNYLDILSSYVVDANSKIELLSDALQKQDLHQFTVHVHALKSASRSIGAEYAANLAEKLEKAGAAGNSEYVNENAETCFEIVEEIVKNINEYFETSALTANIVYGANGAQNVQNDGKQAGNNQYFGHKLNEIRTFAENFDILTVQAIVEELQKYAWSEQNQELLEKIASATSVYDYDEIARLTDNA